MEKLRALQAEARPRERQREPEAQPVEPAPELSLQPSKEPDSTAGAADVQAAAEQLDTEQQPDPSVADVPSQAEVDVEAAAAEPISMEAEREPSSHPVSVHSQPAAEEANVQPDSRQDAAAPDAEPSQPSSGDAAVQLAEGQVHVTDAPAQPARHVPCVVMHPARQWPRSP